ncbi:hypothetical protein PG985_005841 [Apiospora marii]|uniref:uncharacterized protein n=1 Tax=Apiospora marii TaxID=335849 RepID=UPI00312E7122
MSTVTEAITKDHRELEEYYHGVVNSSNVDHRIRYANRFTWELTRHSVGEELIVYPAMKTLPEKLKAIHSAGFDAVALAMPDLLAYGEDLIGKELDARDYDAINEVAKTVKSLAEEVGVRILMLQPLTNFEGWKLGYQDSERKDAFARARGWMRIMEALGTDMLQLGSSDADEISHSTDDFAADLAKLADVCAENGFRLAYENRCWATQARTWRAVWDIVKKADRPNLGLCLDTFQTAGGEFGDPTTETGLIEGLSRAELQSRWRKSLQELAAIVPPERIFLLRISDAYRMDPPIKQSEDGQEQQARSEWSHSYRALPFDGGYLPVHENPGTDFVPRPDTTGTAWLNLMSTVRDKYFMSPCTCRHSRDDKSDLEKPTVSTPNIQRFTGVLAVNNDKVLGRMSSVMSEHSEHMGNGRNDIHGDKNSPLHLRTVSQPSADPSEVSRVPSSSLNVLSESSVNVYGSNDKFTANPQSHSMGFYNDTFDGLPIMNKKLRQDSWECQRGGDASPMRKGTSESSDSLSPQLQSLGTGVDMSPTPQQVGRLEPRLTSGHIRRIPSIASRDSTNSNQIVASARHSQPAAEIKTEQEKKEVLQEELTSTPTNTDLAASRALPPIPDTVPTNTLCRNHNSNDALSCNTPQISIFDENSKASLSQYSIASSLGVRGNAICQPASNTASTSRREAHSQQSSTNLPNQCQYGHPLPPRSHPICESTSSRARANSWASDLEALDGGAGTYPEDEDSSFDYWIREASQGDEGDFCPPPQSHNMRSFSPGGWKARAIFGPWRRANWLARLLQR